MAGYKVAHEAFMANHSGTRAGEIIACLSTAPALVWVLKTVQGHQSGTWWRDYAILALPSLLVITVFTSHIYVTAGILYLAVVVVFVRTRSLPAWSNLPNESQLNTATFTRTTYLTHFKGMCS
jgi:hypothetical protein